MVRVEERRFERSRRSRLTSRSSSDCVPRRRSFSRVSVWRGRKSLHFNLQFNHRKLLLLSFSLLLLDVFSKCENFPLLHLQLQPDPGNFGTQVLVGLNQFNTICQRPFQLRQLLPQCLSQEQASHAACQSGSSSLCVSSEGPHAGNELHLSIYPATAPASWIC